MAYLRFNFHAKPAYAKKSQHPLFLSGPGLVPANPAFTGANAGYNVALALGFCFEQPVLMLDDADLTPDAAEKLSELDAQAVQGECTGIVDEPLFWQRHVQLTLQSLHAGVIKPDTAATQLAGALNGTARSDQAWPCHEALFISAKSADKACLPPLGPSAFDVYANTAFRHGVRVTEPTFAWNRHENQSRPHRFEYAWTKREQTESHIRALDYILEKIQSRTVSDFFIDEAIAQNRHAGQPAIRDDQYQQIVTLHRTALNLAYAPLTQMPPAPNANELKRHIRAHVFAQNDWKDTLRAFGEKGFEERLRVK